MSTFGKLVLCLLAIASVAMIISAETYPMWCCKNQNSEGDYFYPCCSERECKNPDFQYNSQSSGVQDMACCQVEETWNQGVKNSTWTKHPVLDSCNSKQQPALKGQCMGSIWCDNTETLAWKCVIGTDDNGNKIIGDCCDEQCERPVTIDMQLCAIEQVDYEGVTTWADTEDPLRCDKVTRPECSDEELPSMCDDDIVPPEPKYEILCTIDNGATFHECECNQFSTKYTCDESGDNVIYSHCVETSTETKTIVALSNCDTSTDYSPVLTCKCPGQWWCTTSVANVANSTDTSQDVFGPCGCQKFESNQFIYNTTTTHITRTDQPIDLCPDTTDSFTLSRSCVHVNSAFVLTILDDSQCDEASAPSSQECTCPETPSQPDWICSLTIAGQVFYRPCDEICDVATVFGEKICTVGSYFYTHCATKQDYGFNFVSDDKCDKATRPTKPDCEAFGQCHYAWKCAIKIDDELVYFPCDYHNPLCKDVRHSGKFDPCGDFDLVVSCMNSVTGVVASDESMCSGATKPYGQTTTFTQICPNTSAECCKDGDKNCKVYEWQCRARTADYVPMPEIPSSSITLFEQPNIKCTCAPHCGSYYVSSACVVQGTDEVVDEYLCNPDTIPTEHGVSCRSTYQDCNPDDIDKCQLICSIPFGSDRVHFPCEQFKQHCERFGNTFCGQYQVEARCGSVTSDNVFEQSKDKECCSRLQLAWGGNFNVTHTKANSYVCGSSTYNSLQPLDVDLDWSVTDNIFEELSRTNSTNPCKYTWNCIDGVPQCQRWSANDPKPTNVPSDECHTAGYPSPSSQECKQDNDDIKYMFLCRVQGPKKTAWSNCKDLSCDSFQRCESTTIVSQCHSMNSTSTSWSISSNQNCLSAGLTSPLPGTSFIHTCPGNSIFCEHTPEPEPVIDHQWKCFINGLQFYEVPCSCDKVVDEYSQEVVKNRFGCEFKLSASCFDNLGNVALNSFCQPPSGPLEDSVWDVCNHCDEEEEPRTTLKCYKNGDVTQPIDCDKGCNINGDCQFFYIQGICHITNAPDQVRPFSECQQQFNTLINLGYNEDMIKKCESHHYHKSCNTKWVCRALVNTTSTALPSTDFIEFDCDRSDACANYPFGCRSANVTNVCVTYASGSPSNVEHWSPVSPNVCTSIGLLPPLGYPEATTQCPRSFQSSCGAGGIIRPNFFDWLCVDEVIDSTTGAITSSSTPYPCSAGTSSCKHRTSLTESCAPFTTTAYCYSQGISLVTGEVTHDRLSADSCDAELYPVRDAAGAPTTRHCDCPQKCKNRALNWPLCNKWLIDDISIIDDEIIWDVNPPHSPLDPVDPCLAPVHNLTLNTALIHQSDDYWFATLGSGRADLNSGSMTLTNGIDTRAIKNPNASSVIVRSNFTSPCGIIELPPISVVPWCARVKCDSSRTCDNFLQQCVCKPGTWGPNCENTNCPVNMELSTENVDNKVIPHCVCSKGFVYDDVADECVEKCPTKQRNCGVNGTWNKKSCQCECNDGFFTPTKAQAEIFAVKKINSTVVLDFSSCSCFETFATIKLAKQPKFEKEEVTKLWTQVFIEYFQYDTSHYNFNFDFDVVSQSVQDDGSFVVVVRLRTCDQQVFNIFNKAYDHFVDNFMKPNSLNVLTAPEDDVPVYKFETLLTSDIVVSHAGGITQLNKTTQVGPEGNNTTMISSLFAIVIALVIVVM